MRFAARARWQRDYYRLLSEANAYSCRAFDGKGLLFGQIGLDIQPCRINCKFYSLAADVLKDCVPVVRDLHSRETGVKIKADLSFISVSGHEVYIKETLLILRKRRSVRRIG